MGARAPKLSCCASDSPTARSWPPRLAREYGATDIIEARGDDGVAKIKELTNGLGAHSVVEAVGTQESMMQAIHSARYEAMDQREAIKVLLRP